MTVSLIITTYNWPRALYLCLDSVMQQTVMPSEILVADDGSGISTRDVVRHFQNISPVPVHHIWHEDRGFRVAAIRNKAIAASSGDYVIHVDGDLILQRNFIQDHILFAREGCYVSGSRGIITEMLTQKVLSGEITSLSALTKGVRNSNNVMRVPVMAIVYRMIAPLAGPQKLQSGVVAPGPDPRQRIRRGIRGLGIRRYGIGAASEQQRRTAASHEIPGRRLPPPSRQSLTGKLRHQRTALSGKHPRAPHPLRKGPRPAPYPENILSRGGVCRRRRGLIDRHFLCKLFFKR